jgi:hypothetical protein
MSVHCEFCAEKRYAPQAGCGVNAVDNCPGLKQEEREALLEILALARSHVESGDCIYPSPPEEKRYAELFDKVQRMLEEVK